MILIVLAHSLDLLSFAIAAHRLGIGGEANPLARFVYEHAGILGVTALKLAALLLIVHVLSGVTDSPGKAVAIVLIALLGALGAATNLYAVLR